MRILRNVTLLAAVVALAVAVAPVANAKCDSPAFVRTLGPAGVSWIHIDNWSTAGYYYYGLPGYGVGGYGRPPVTTNFDAVWWVLGDGDTASGSGQDNGTYLAGQSGGWFSYAYNPAYPGFFYAGALNGNWANTSVDGCISTDNASPSGNCVCVLMQDLDAGKPLYAVVQAVSNASANAEMLAPGSDGNGNAGKIVLKAMPKITVLATARDSLSNDLDLSVTVANDGGGVYSSVEGADASGCNCLQGWQVYSKSVGRGGAPPTDRSKSGWTLMNTTGGGAQGVNNFGASISVEELCGDTNQDIFLAAGLVVDSNMNNAPYADYISDNSTRVECGPQIADPEPIRPRIRPDAPRQLRGTQRSR